MAHVLVSFQSPHPEDKKASAGWLTFADGLRSIVPPLQESEKLAETVFLLALENRLATLSMLLEAAKTNAIAYRVLLIESAPVAIK